MNAIVFDTETTDLVDPEIVEASWMFASFAGSGGGRGAPALRFDAPETRRFKPSRRIAMGAMSTHHIMDEDLEDCPASSSFRLPPGVAYLIGHNVDFDWRAAGEPVGVRRIDTLALARRFWPACDAHSLGAITYYLFRSTAREQLRSAHSAETDVRLAGAIVNEVLAIAGAKVDSFEKLWMLSEESRVPDVMPFGKHKGQRIADVPADYKAWLLRQPDVDPYLAQALRRR